MKKILLLFFSIGALILCGTNEVAYACHAINTGGSNTDGTAATLQSSEDTTDPCMPTVSATLSTTSTSSGNSFPCGYTGTITATNTATGGQIGQNSGDLTVTAHGPEYTLNLTVPICPGNTTQVDVVIIRDSNGASIFNSTANVVSSVPAFDPTFALPVTTVCTTCPIEFSAADYRCNAVFTGTNVTDNADGSGSFDPNGLAPGNYDITYTIAPGSPCEVSQTHTVTVIECECLVNTCLGDDITHGLMPSGLGAPFTDTYILVDGTTIIDEDNGGMFPTDDGTGATGDPGCGTYTVYQVSYDATDPSLPPLWAPGSNFGALDGSQGNYEVNCFFCEIRVYSPTMAVPPKLAACSGVDVCQDFMLTDLSCMDVDGDNIGQGGGFAIGAIGTNLPVAANVGTNEFSFTTSNTDTGNPASGGPTADAAMDLMYTTDGGTAGGAGTFTCFDVQPIHTPDFDMYVTMDSGNTSTSSPGSACTGEVFQFGVCVASTITVTSPPACNENEFTIDVAGGFPDFAATDCDGNAVDFPAADYTFEIDGNAAAPASGTITDGGMFTFTGQTAGCHTVRIIDHQASLAVGCAAAPANPACFVEIDVEVYDPFEIDFDYTCADNTIIVTNITGGQDLTTTWCAGAVPQYDVTINGTTQSATATGDFPLTFTGLAEGTYTVEVRDAITDPNGVNCGADFQAEAYDPIVMTDNFACITTGDNTIDVDVVGGQPDHPGTTDIQTGTNGAADGTTSYALTSYMVTSSIDGALGATDAAGNINSNGLTAGCHTLTFQYDLLDADGANIDGDIVGTDTNTDCMNTIDVEVYDPFNIDFDYTCTDGQIVVTNITGGQDPAVTWCTGTVAQYDVTINGSTQSVTAPADFPLTFTGLAEGTYDVIVADALGCGYTFQAEAYDPIVLTDNGNRCNPYHQINVTVDGGQPDHPGTTDILSNTNATTDGTTVYTFADYDVTSDIDGALGSTDATGNITTTTNSAGADLQCGSHELTFEYDLLDADGISFDPDAVGADLTVDCSNTIRVDVYEDIEIVVATPACGEIDIVSVLGGWDPNCANGWDNPPPGYTITISGPNNSALTAAASYTVGPLSAFAGTEYTAGNAAGVPLNGLPGGTYTVTIDDGRNGTCLDVFVDALEIVGCCPASSDANTDYQLCGMNAPSSQPSTGMSMLPATTPIIGDLPDLTIDNAATNLNIDTDTDLTLNTDDVGSGQDAGGDGVDWFLGPNPLTDTPYSDAAMVSATICDAGIYTLYAFLRCDGNHDGNFNPTQTGTNPGSEVGFDPDDGTMSGVGIDSYIPAGMVTVTVWPELAVPDITYPNFPVECQINLINPCPGVYQLEVTDDDGNNYIADNTANPDMLFLDIFAGQYTYDGLATPNPGTIGDLTLTITNQAAIAAFDAANPGGDDSYSDGDNPTCREVTFDRPYVCCLAEAGNIPDVGIICPDPSAVNNCLPVTIDDFRGDIDLFPFLPDYYTFIVVYHTNSGLIVDVIAMANSAGGVLTPGPGPLTTCIPYSDFENYPPGVGEDYTICSYNTFSNNLPAPANMPIGMTVPGPNGPVTGTAINIADVIIANSPEDGCYDINCHTPVFIPDPMDVLCDNSLSQGAAGGISPFYYNIHEICLAGGTPNYRYEWDTRGFVRHNVFLNPPQGDGDEKIRIIYADNAFWSVTVYDANNCTYPGWIFSNEQIGQNLLEIDSYNTTPATVAGGCQNGSVEILVDNGTPPYAYTWSGPFNWSGGPIVNATASTGDLTISGANGETAALNGVPSGWYSVTVTDNSTPQMMTMGWYWIYCVVPGRGKTTTDAISSVEAYPNPVANETKIEFSVATAGKTQLKLYSVDGQEVLTIFDGQAESHQLYTLPFGSGGLSNGLYILRLTTESGEVQNTKLMIAR